MECQLSPRKVRGTPQLASWSAQGGFLLFAFLAGVDAFMKDGGNFRAFDADFFQADFRVHAKRKPFILSGKAVLETPPLAPAGGNFQIQAAFVKVTLALEVGAMLRISRSVSDMGATLSGYCLGAIVAPKVAPVMGQMSLVTRGKTRSNQPRKP